MPAARPGKWILFRTGRTLLGARLQDVIRLVSGENMAFIPRAGQKVKGAVLFEGKAVPVFKVGGDNGHDTPDGENLVLLMEHKLGPVGVVVDKIVGVVDESDMESGEETEIKFRGEPVMRVSPEEAVSPVVPDD